MIISHYCLRNDILKLYEEDDYVIVGLFIQLESPRQE
jgi:hypothetical protein